MGPEQLHPHTHECGWRQGHTEAVLTHGHEVFVKLTYLEDLLRRGHNFPPTMLKLSRHSGEIQQNLIGFGSDQVAANPGGLFVR